MGVQGKSAKTKTSKVHTTYKKKKGSKLKIIFHAPFDILATTPRIQHSKSPNTNTTKEKLQQAQKEKKKKNSSSLYNRVIRKVILS